MVEDKRRIVVGLSAGTGQHFLFGHLGKNSD